VTLFLEREVWKNLRQAFTAAGAIKSGESLLKIALMSFAICSFLVKSELQIAVLWRAGWLSTTYLIIGTAFGGCCFILAGCIAKIIIRFRSPKTRITTR